MPVALVLFLGTVLPVVLPSGRTSLPTLLCLKLAVELEEGVALVLESGDRPV